MTNFGGKTEFDLIVTDPPYNVGKDFGNDTDQQTDDSFYEFMWQRIELLPPIIDPQGQIIMFASQSHIYEVMRAVAFRTKLHYRRMMMWHYKNGLSRQERGPVTEFEPMLWYSKSNTDWSYNKDDVRVPYRSERVKSPVYKKNKNGEKIAWNPDPRGAKRGDVWEYPCLAGKLYEDERTEHPTQKPENLITDIIKAFCPKVDGKYCGKILDPFHGSGTVGACCEILNAQGHNIKWLGIELEQKWVDVANERVEVIRNKSISLL